jgi:DNA-binding transcriptional ArsR family regulator
MKPLYHPAIKDVTVEGLLYALSDPIRVQIYAEIAKADCPKMCSAFLEFKNIKLSKSTLSYHFRILREAGLIRSVRQGTKMHNVTRCDELQTKFGVMLTEIVEAYARQTKRSSAK